MSNPWVYPNRTKVYERAVALCLLALLLSFATLVPGGPIENRDFSQMTEAAYWAFNVYLIALSLAGFWAAYGVWRGKRGALWAAIAIGWSYVAVVALDLGHVFPRSPDQASLSLGLVMIVDGILALNVVLFSHRALGHL